MRLTQVDGIDAPRTEGAMFRVWHYTNPPHNDPTVIDCGTIEQAVAAADAIAIHELNLGDAMVSSNAQGIQVWVGEWDDIEYHLDSVLVGEVGRAYVEREY